MPTFLDRLRDALRPEYDVQRELASGGMGLVFLAREVALERLVAIKVLRPELATAPATEQFLREARLLAQLVHPNIVPVHRAGETAGFAYYVMDYLSGDTLAERLERGPLPPPQALKLGRDLLDALQAVHQLDVIHRDIKPSNIFLRDGRALLGDFGITRPSGSRDVVRTSRRSSQVGTPEYMPPEQTYGWELDPRTDLYAAAMVIYEAYTGGRWTHVLPDDHPDFSGVPAGVAKVLRRALSWDPTDRWPDATQFRHALWKTRTAKYRWRTVSLTAAALALGVTTAVWLRPTAEPADLAFHAFTASGEAGTEEGRDIAHLIALNVHIDGLTVKPPGPAADSGARAVVSGTMRRTGDSVFVVATVTQRGQAVAIPVSGSRADPQGVACEAALHIVRLVAPAGARHNRCNGMLSGTTAEAIHALLEGERAASTNRWRTALGHYARALDADPSFALAALRHRAAHSWLLRGTAPKDYDLRAMFTAQRDMFAPDSFAFAALLAPGDSARFAIYAQAVARFPNDGFLAFLYADAVFHRGAFLGIPLERAGELLTAAATRDSSFAPVWHHVAWLWTRLGDSARAAAAIKHLGRVDVPPDEVDYLPQLASFAFSQRFGRDLAAPVNAAVFADAALVAHLETGFRLAPSFGVVEFQLAFARELHRRLVATGVRDRRRLGGLMEAQALSLVALGRPTEALARFDSAAVLLGSGEARLQAAAWRALAPGLGLDVPHAETDRGMIAAGTFTGPLAARGQWLAGTAAAWRGDTIRSQRSLQQLEAATDSIGPRLAQLLNATLAGARADFAAALRLSQPLLPFDSAGRGGDPFARAVLHLERARWLRALGQLEAADSSLRWYQHSDHIVQPAGVANAAEIDWAVSTSAQHVRAELAFALGRIERGCGMARWVTERWRHSEPATSTRRAGAQRLLQAHCRP